MTILIAEDDWFHAEVLTKRLGAHNEGATIVIATSEKEFKEKFEAMDKADLSMILLDQMLPWTDEADSDPFTGAPAEGPLRAGSRCYEFVRSDEGGKTVPIVFFTNLDKSTIPEGVDDYVQKRADPGLEQLLKRTDAVISPKE